MITKGDKIAFAIILVFLILTVVFWKDVRTLLGPKTEMNEADAKSEKKNKKKNKKDKKDKKDNSIRFNSQMIFCKEGSSQITRSTAYVVRNGEHNYNIVVGM